MTNELIVGQPAPAFSSIAVGGEYGNGTPLSLASLRGKTVVLYFYPKDDTPGCTTQACGIRDTHTKFTSQNIVVLGVSADSPEKHRKFAEKFSLPFPLLSDEGHNWFGLKKACMGKNTWASSARLLSSVRTAF